MKKLIEVGLKDDTMLLKILDEYCEDMWAIPTEQGKEYFRRLSGIVPSKAIRQLVFAGIFWALKHPEEITTKYMEIA